MPEIPPHIIELLSREWAGNSLARALAALSLFFALSIFFAVIYPFLIRRAEAFARRTRMKLDDVFAAFLHSSPRRALYLLSLLIALSLLRLPETAHVFLRAGVLLIAVSLGINLAGRLLEYALLQYSPSLRSASGQSLPVILRITIVGVLWCFGALLILSNLGVNVLSLLTGLGIGGIAVALAVQNILGDMFSSFALYMDKPFREGDFIIVGPHMGTVKSIGIKTTRLEALQGEEIIISNHELTTSRVQNFKRMNQRRIVFRFGVTYDTPPEKLRKVCDIVRSIIAARELARLDRVHFASFGDSSLDFEVVYYVGNSEYNVYMDLQQEINLELHQKLHAEGIAFAFPTRTVHLISQDRA